MKKSTQTINFCPICENFLEIIKYLTDFYYSCNICGYNEKAILDLETFKKEMLINLEYKEVDPLQLVKFRKWKESYLKSKLSNFICPYCGSNNAFIYYRHMRSYSKPTNLFIECINCIRFLRWKNL